VIVNAKFWNGLPPDIRGQLEKAMNEATDYTNSIARKENEDALAEIKKTGKTTLHYPTDAERKAWQTAMQPTYKWAKGRVGQEVLDVVAKELHVEMN
jgi:C4-dicarboxylate-binding protein DctP